LDRWTSGEREFTSVARYRHARNGAVSDVTPAPAVDEIRAYGERWR
jgi:hypothetical protein